MKVKKALLILTSALIVGQTSITAMAHCHGYSRCKASAATTYSVCCVEDCTSTKVHCHDGVTCLPRVQATNYNTCGSHHSSGRHCH